MLSSRCVLSIALIGLVIVLPRGTQAQESPQESPAYTCLHPDNYTYSSWNCHSAANLNVLNGNTTGIVQCQGTPGSQGNHTINYSLQGDPLGNMVNVTFNDINGASCTCTIPFLDRDAVTGQLDMNVIQREPRCAQCISQTCPPALLPVPVPGVTPEFPTPTIRQPGQLAQIPGNMACVRETLHGDATNPSALGDYDDPMGEKYENCISCCGSHNDIILAWIDHDQDEDTAWKQRQEAAREAWFHNCQMMCSVSFAGGTGDIRSPQSPASPSEPEPYLLPTIESPQSPSIPAPIPMPMASPNSPMVQTLPMPMYSPSPSSPASYPYMGLW